MLISCIFQCLACRPGTWSSGAIGRGEDCTLCAAGTFSTSSGGASIGVCTSCDAGTSSSGLGLSQVREFSGRKNSSQGVSWRGLACICLQYPSLSPDPSPSLDWDGMGGIGGMGWFRRVYSRLRPWFGYVRTILCKPRVRLCWAGICRHALNSAPASLITRLFLS